MRCAFCGNEETKVTDKRESGEYTRRRRECLKCGKRFTTYEKPDIEIIVVKKDGRRERFNREKLILGLIKACEKRAISTEEINKIIEEIEEKLRKKGKEVESKIIGKLVMKALKKLDNVAYIRFASVYLDFKDLGDFRKELKELKAGGVK